MLFGMCIMLERAEERMDKDKKTKQCKQVSQLLDKCKGESLRTACVNCDVSRSTFNKWKAKQTIGEET